MKYQATVGFLLWSLYVASGQDDDLEREGAPRVATEEGEVEGFPAVYPMKPNVTVNVYLGIPYARPVYRFGPPVFISPWTGIHRATRIPPACPQKPFPFQRFIPAIRKWSLVQPYDENCLSLNVWSPRVVAPVLLPVIVFIHGGGFMKGTSTLPVFDGLPIAALHNVVVVTFNYRVSSFGFLYLDHPNAPGNAGILDQIMALQWVQRNARSFGGDPSMVTVAGHSAGAVSISYLLLSHLSQGLFNRAILLSGGPTSNWAFGSKEESLRLAEKLVVDVGCTSTNKTAVIECLQRASVEDILNGEPGFGYDDLFVFKPTVDGHFLTDHPRTLLERGNLTEVDILLSSVPDEASIFLPGQLPVYFSITGSKPYVTRDAFIDGLTILSGLDGFPLRLVQHEYTVWQEPDNGELNAQALKDMFSDSYFNCAETEMADAYADSKANLYRILFDHRSEASLWPTWMGVSHSDDILYFFGEPLRPGLGYSEEDSLLSRKFMNLLVGFSKNGNITLDGTVIEPYTRNQRVITRITVNGIKVHTGYRDKQCNLWNKILPQANKISKIK